MCNMVTTVNNTVSHIWRVFKNLQRWNLTPDYPIISGMEAGTKSIKQEHLSKDATNFYNIYL